MSRSPLGHDVDERTAPPPPFIRVQVEFFGVPRLKAGMARLDLELPVVDPFRRLSDLQRLLDRLADVVPSLVGPVLIRVSADQPATLHPAYRLSLDTEEFLDDPTTLLVPDARLLLLSADLGG